MWHNVYARKYLPVNVAQIDTDEYGVERPSLKLIEGSQKMPNQ